MIVKARQAASEFVHSLPNFICQERIARFRSEVPPGNWQPRDVLTAELVFANGKEQYRNVRVNGKPVRRRLEQLKGAWSTGEFGSVLVQLLSPSTGTQFRPGEEDAQDERTNFAFYHFTVSREQSQWMIVDADRGIMPPYQGSLQIDMTTGRIHRIERQATDMPAGFSAKLVESTIEYHPLEIAGRLYLMPAQSEMIICFRGRNSCVKNVITFSRYQKYGSESHLWFGASAGPASNH